LKKNKVWDFDKIELHQYQTTNLLELTSLKGVMHQSTCILLNGL